MKTRIVHHNDCFWCKKYQEVLVPMKGRKTHVREVCGLDGHNIPAPFSSPDLGQRWCEKYQQKKCECAHCVTNVEPNVTNISTKP